MTQAVNTIVREKQQGQRLWMVVALACALITLPIVPFNPKCFLNINSESLSNFNEMISLFWHEPPQAALVAEHLPESAPPCVARGAMTGIRSLTEAVDDLNDQIQQTPDDPSLNNRIGILYEQLGEQGAAIDHFDLSVETSRRQIANLIANEKNCLRSGDRPGAAQAVLAISKLKVELAAAHSNLAHIYDRLGKHEGVVAQLDQLNKDIAWASDGAPGKSFSGRAFGEAQPINEAPLAGSRLQSTTAASLARGQAFLQERRFQEAADEYRRLISVDPHLAIAHQQLGLTAALSNDFSLAVSEFETAARLDPKDANNHNDLGLVYLAGHNDAAAKGEFARACSLDPKNVDAAINLANLLAADEQYDIAIQALEKAVSLNANSAIGHNNLATLFSLTDRPKEAIKEFELAIKLKPDLACAHYGLGLAYFNMQSYPTAIKEFKSALQINPALEDAHNKIEQAYHKNELAANNVPGVN